MCRLIAWCVCVLALVCIPSVDEVMCGDNKIDPYAVSKITKKDYPKLYSQWGDSGLKKINALMPLAAERVASSAECDKVILVDISISRSVPGKSIVYFVDCNNGKRFYVSDSELQSSMQVVSQKAKMSLITDEDAIVIVERAVKKQLYNPSSFKRKFGSASVYRAPVTANISVNFDYSALNGYGIRFEKHVRCIITDKGVELN